MLFQLCFRPALQCGLIAIAAIVSTEFDYELSYVRALRDRGLHRLSALQCNRLLDTDNLDQSQRVLAVVELSKTLTSQALHSRAPQREQFWREAFDVLTRERQLSGSTSSVLLLDVQRALTTLQQAEWTRREAEVRSRTDDDWELARSQIREAIKQLKEAEQKLSRPQVRSGQTRMSVARVSELLRNTRYQLARAYRNQAITYADRPADRVSSLTLALKLLQPLASDLAVDHLVWQSRVDRIECHRLRGDLERASQLIAAAGDAPDRYIGKLAAEGVRLALAARQPQLALRLVQDRQVASRDPDLELARVEALVEMTQSATDGTISKQYQQQAAAIVSRISCGIWNLLGTSRRNAGRSSSRPSRGWSRYRSLEHGRGDIAQASPS